METEKTLYFLSPYDTPVDKGAGDEWGTSGGQVGGTQEGGLMFNRGQNDGLP